VNPLQVGAVLRLAVPVLAALLFATAACGGDESSAGDAKRVVRDFVEATNERDGDTLCGELLTHEYMEKATGATGDDAEEECTRQLDLLKGLRLELVSIGEATVDGDEATVRAVIATGGQRMRRVFTLAEEDGAWRLVSGASAGQ
jgi:hypothetical protein